MSEEKPNTALLLGGGVAVLAVVGCCCFGSAATFWSYQVTEKAADELEAERELRYGPRLSDVGFQSYTPPTTPRPLDASPRMVEATVTIARGTSGVRVGDTCRVPVEIRDRTSGWWCHTEITCGGRTVFGGPTLGFFPCAIFEDPLVIMGVDGQTTALSRDGAFGLDTRDEFLVVEDDTQSALGAFHIEARVTSVE